MARQARPDIDVHVMVENAADIEDPRATAVRQMLGIDPVQWAPGAWMSSSPVGTGRGWASSRRS
eukprot:4632685-Alexandrium_andersonii.AAC.1